MSVSPDCTGTTKAGAPCRWKATHGALCLAHAAQAGDPAAKDALNARASRGGAKALRERVAITPLRTAADIRSLLDELIAEVRNSKGEKIPKANAIEKLLRLSADLLKVHELEAELSELRRAFAEVAPEKAKAYLRAVK